MKTFFYDCIQIGRAAVRVDLAQGHPSGEASHVLGRVQLGRACASAALELPRRQGQSTLALQSRKSLFF